VRSHQWLLVGTACVAIVLSGQASRTRQEF
jgi:hypothetical protein